MEREEPETARLYGRFLAFFYSLCLLVIVLSSL
jgi:hypothetical protein